MPAPSPSSDRNLLFGILALRLNFIDRDALVAAMNACFVSLCAPLAAKDAALPEAKRKEVASSYADRAMALLRQAVQHGYKNIAHMSKDSDLDPLRGRDDFRKLLAELDGPREPLPPPKETKE